MRLMLRTLRQHPLLLATAEVLSDALRYLTIMLVVITILGKAAGLAF
jgi:hypothetical protein